MRKICEHCKVEQDLDQLQEDWLFSSYLTKEARQTTFYTGKGCHHCNGTGYRGRIGIYEFLEVDDAAGKALQNNDSAALAAAARAQATYRSLPEHAMELAMNGITSLEEVFRVTEAVTNQELNDG
jgi:MSHA biogenesis protein MshE